MGDPGYAELDRMTRMLGGLGKALVEDSAPALGEILLNDVRNTTRAGTDAYGNPWPKTQDGEPALEHTPEAIKLLVQGSKITLRLEGYRARHHRGYAQGGVQRAVLPTQGLIPPKTVRKMHRALEKRFADATKAGA